MQNKLFVRNLSFDTTDADLAELFSKHGEVVSAKIVLDRDTNQSRGFAFVEMSSQTSAEAAVTGLNGVELGGRSIHVAISEPRKRPVNRR